MKKTIIYTMVLIACSIQLQGQCSINYQDALASYCSGEYLIHYELSNQDLSGVLFILEKENTYTLYMLNPNLPFSNYRFHIDSFDITEDFQDIEDNKAISYNIDPDESGEYHFSVKSSSEEKACVLLAIYLQHDADANMSPGIYRSFDELKRNSPGEEFNCTLKQRKVGRIGKEHYYTYRLVTDKESRERIGAVYGFYDGHDLYLNLHAKPRTLRKSSDFVKAESIGEYYYVEIFQSVYYTTGNNGGWVQNSVLERIIHKESGEAIKLSSSSLKKLIQDDAELLAEFKQERQKSRKLKEYLLRYMNR